MRQRLAPIVLVPLLALLAGGCTPAGYAPAPYGIGYPQGGAGLFAPWEFGRTETLAGQPADAALAALRVEQFALAAEREPLWQTTSNPLVQPQLRMARAEMREALGIDPRLPPAAAIVPLSRAAEALAYNDPGAAERALTAPGFALGGAGTLARLSALPRLRLVDEAAQTVAQVAHPSGRRG